LDADHSYMYYAYERLRVTTVRYFLLREFVSACLIDCYLVVSHFMANRKHVLTNMDKASYCNIHIFF